MVNSRNWLLSYATILCVLNHIFPQLSKTFEPQDVWFSNPVRIRWIQSSNLASFIKQISFICFHSEIIWKIIFPKIGKLERHFSKNWKNSVKPFFQISNLQILEKQINEAIAGYMGVRKMSEILVMVFRTFVGDLSDLKQNTTHENKPLYGIVFQPLHEE